MHSDKTIAVSRRQTITYRIAVTCSDGSSPDKAIPTGQSPQKLFLFVSDVLRAAGRRLETACQESLFLGHGRSIRALRVRPGARQTDAGNAMAAAWAVHFPTAYGFAGLPDPFSSARASLQASQRMRSSESSVSAMGFW